MSVAPLRVRELKQAAYVKIGAYEIVAPLRVRELKLVGGVCVHPGGTMLEHCLHGEEVIVLGDRGYHKKNRTLDDFEKEGDLMVLTPAKKPAGGTLTAKQKAFNRMLSSVRAIVEHPFRVLKRQFGFVKVRYRGLAKNTGQIVTLFALANLWLARKRWSPLLGEVRP